MNKLLTTAFLLFFSAIISFGQSDNVKAIKKDINQPAATNAVTYDFTTGADKYYGGDAAAVEVETGVWAMIAGDADGSGVVDAADRSATWNDRNVSGYNNSDVDLTGITDAADRSSTWNNRNKSTQVPN